MTQYLTLALLLFAVAWILAGLFYADGVLKMAASHEEAELRELANGMRDFDPASLVALVFFILVWPLPLITGLRQRRQNARAVRDAAAEQYVHDLYGR